MSSDPDRIAVPTNGRRPHPVPAETDAAAGTDDKPTSSTAAGSPGGLSPQQLAVGFAIVASLIAIAAGMARRRVRR